MIGPPPNPLEPALPDPRSSHRTHVGLEQRVLARLKRVGLPAGAGVTVGFSGGADSLALAAVLARLAPVAEVRPLLVHVDHGLRAESAADAIACGRLAVELGLPFLSIRLLSSCLARHTGVGIEEAARRERYVALVRGAEANGSALVAVAHHRDDQAETVLLHLLRGAGLSGAMGMAEMSRVTVPWWEPRNGDETRTIDLWRPFLDEARETVRGYAADAGLTPVEDDSNADLRFRRNRIRHEVMPRLREVMPGADATLARYARIAATDDALLREIAARSMARVRRLDSSLSLRELTEEHPAIQRRLVITWLRELGVAEEIALDRVDAVIDAVERRRGGCQIQIGGGWSSIVTDGALVVRSPSDARENIDESDGDDEEAT